ncbi:MAG: radical SAM protein [Vicinamibacterales bacterium]
MRGDAEAAFPKLLDAIAGRASFDEVPNLVGRGPDGRPAMSRFEHIDIEAHPSPRFAGAHRTVPYESMRGCPFTCKYCSFPAASPKWRFKSAEKIVHDWQSYADANGAGLIAALDSTFTIPPARMRKLLDLLPGVRVPWYSFSRADNINTPEMVQRLEAAHCRGLAIGFESMCDKTLLAMDKKVTADENRRAYDLLNNSSLLVNGSFIVGYPGETPEDFDITHRFLAHELRGRFSLSVFSVIDETMPVWAEAGTYGLVETDDGWEHCGMNRATAVELLGRTVQATRWQNEDAVMITWQVDYATPLASGLGLTGNRRVEKLVERLTFLPRDIGTDADAAVRVRDMLQELETMGVRTGAAEASATA